MGHSTRRNFLKTVGWGALGLSLEACRSAGEKTRRPNILLITADDMNYNSPGCYGSSIPGITPSIDRLAEEGMRFSNAHVNIAVCQPHLARCPDLGRTAESSRILEWNSGQKKTPQTRQQVLYGFCARREGVGFRNGNRTGPDQI